MRPVFVNHETGIAISNNFALQMLKSESWINSLFDGRNLSRVDAGVVIDRIPQLTLIGVSCTRFFAL